MQNVALITGASSGIGKALAFEHAKRGGDMVLVARDQAGLQAVATSLEEQHQVVVKIVVADLVAPGAVDSLMSELQAANITISILINNAGIGGQGYFHEREEGADLAMIQLNIAALTELTRAIVPGMVARGEGRVLQVASSAALVPGGPLQAVYFATKAYVLSFSYGVAEELRGTGVTTTALCPGATKTNFGATAGLEKTKLFSGNLFSAEAVAADGYAGMLAGKLRVLSALTLVQRVQMVLIPFVPTRLLLRQIKRVQETK